MGKNEGHTDNSRGTKRRVISIIFFSAVAFKVTCVIEFRLSIGKIWRTLRGWIFLCNKKNEISNISYRRIDKHPLSQVRLICLNFVQILYEIISNPPLVIMESPDADLYYTTDPAIHEFGYMNHS